MPPPTILNLKSHADSSKGGSSLSFFVSNQTFDFNSSRFSDWKWEQISQYKSQWKGSKKGTTTVRPVRRRENFHKKCFWNNAESRKINREKRGKRKDTQKGKRRSLSPCAPAVASAIDHHIASLPITRCRFRWQLRAEPLPWTAVVVPTSSGSGFGSLSTRD